MVISDLGVVATSQILASQAATQILARGGSAMDAAIAANIVLCVVEPMSCGLGGDLFALYREAKTARITGINASGWSPRGFTPGALAAAGVTGVPQYGIHSTTVPGCVDGWAKLHARFGRVPWPDLFQAAIYHADHGFAVTELAGEGWHCEADRVAADANSRKVYYPGGLAPRVGQRFANPQMGAALKAIARGRAEVFYRGEIAAAIVRTSARLGGTLAADDLGEFESEWVRPISTQYRGWSIYELPPNGQGIAALEMLNILSSFPLASLPARGAEELHLQIEAQKLAYADLHRFVADPRVSRVPVAELLSAAYARQRAALIDPTRAVDGERPGNPLPAQGDTVNLAVVDREGNIASLIQSVFKYFGSGVTVDDYGFALQNRAATFETDPAHPNALGPRKRPFQTIIPALMENGHQQIGFGIMGGLNQAQAHAQFVCNLLDHGMNLQAAVDAPRFSRLTFGGREVTIESRVPPAVRAALEAKGHQLNVVGDYSSVMGGAQVVMRDALQGLHYGASDPRKDGAALAEVPAYFG